ncbi:hypothetical protein HPB51_021530 [Rhipicephalus microplus]|uniref:Uncharacterized protein n=1 Tax=Rhipicephalus microplus TaxID=6941 RepID=A0A9J6DJI9_RHIMP|nr:hypothetical protein HPB51_021530 [Rhipicephalus microplus]
MSNDLQGDEQAVCIMHMIDIESMRTGKVEDHLDERFERCLSRQAGRYQVPLMLQEPGLSTGRDKQELAARRLNMQQNRFRQQPVLLQQYDRIITTTAARSSPLVWPAECSSSPVRMLVPFPAAASAVAPPIDDTGAGNGSDRNSSPSQLNVIRLLKAAMDYPMEYSTKAITVLSQHMWPPLGEAELGHLTALAAIQGGLMLGHRWDTMDSAEEDTGGDGSYMPYTVEDFQGRPS